VGTCCDSGVCGFPPGGEDGTRAFAALLRWPTLLRTLLVTQFFCWFVWVPWPGLALLLNMITVGAIYWFAYFRLVKAANAEPMDDDIYR